MIVLVTVVLNRTVVVDSDRRFDNPCGSDFQCQMCFITSVDGIKTRPDWSIKSRCYWSSDN